MWSAERYPQDYGVLAADYQNTLACIQRTLQASAGKGAELSDCGETIYAAVLPPSSEFGAIEGDDHLVLIVVESRHEQGPTDYRLALKHLAQDGSDSPPPEMYPFYTDFAQPHLDEYWTERAAELREMLSYAAQTGRFDPQEAWYWVDSDHPSATIVAAREGQLTSERLVLDCMRRQRKQTRGHWPRWLGGDL